MASPNAVYNGGASGATLATRTLVYASGVYRYVSSVSGDNTYDGLSRKFPTATIVQANTNATAGDTIVLLEEHTETFTSALALKADVGLFAEGGEATRARLTPGHGGAAIDPGARAWLENIYFLEPTVTAGFALDLGAAGIRAWNCRVDCGAETTGGGVAITTGASALRLRDCQFYAVSTDAAAPPANGILISAAVSDVELERLTFQGDGIANSVGWGEEALKTTAAVTGLVGVDIDFLGGSDLLVATGSLYRVHARNLGGASNLVFTS